MTSSFIWNFASHLKMFTAKKKEQINISICNIVISLYNILKIYRKKGAIKNNLSI